MSASERKIAANRANGRKSHGPTDTTSTRFNATKHGLLAVGITELDDAEGYSTTLRGLINEKNPVGAIEMFLVESAAVEMTRLPRARRLEAEHITAALNPPSYSSPFPDFGELEMGQIIDPGLPAQMQFENIQRLVTHQRYETAIANRLFRTLHELERLQRMRLGERLPAPVTVDVNVHADAQGLDSLAKSATENAVESSQSTLDDKEAEEINESLLNG